MKEGTRLVVCKEKCHICGNVAEFNISDSATLLRDAVCSICGVTIRTSDLAGEILKAYGEHYPSLEDAGEKLPLKMIVNTCTSGFVHEYFKVYPGYICGEYLDNVRSGEYKNGVLCIDLCSLPFADNSIDLLVSEDVFEHVFDYPKAFLEVNRALKMGGKHIFTVPIHENRNTVSRIGNEKKVFHGDPIRPEEGSVVCTDFGKDITDILQQYGFESEIVVGHKFYESNEITNCDESYDEYISKKDKLEEYFKYNSIVIISEKVKNFGEESLRPKKLFNNSMDLQLDANQMEYEYLHRYYAVRDLVSEKKVLNIGSDEGYGSYILSLSAMSVLGISDDKDLVDSANQKYAKQKNLRFSYNLYEKLSDIETESIDVVVSFEAIEYLDEGMRYKLLGEIKRVLSKDGILIISSTDKMGYSHKYNYKNGYHNKLYLKDEFMRFVSEKFKRTYLYKQCVEVASFIQHDDVISENVKCFEGKRIYNSTPKYNILIATDNLNYNVDISSVCVNETDSFYLLNQQIESYRCKVEQNKETIRIQNEELERRLQELQNRMNLINELNRNLQEKEAMLKAKDELLAGKCESTGKNITFKNMFLKLENLFCNFRFKK